VSENKEYYFVVTNGFSVVAHVKLTSDHPHKQDFVRAAKRGLALIYKVEEKQILRDQTYNQKVEG